MLTVSGQREGDRMRLRDALAQEGWLSQSSRLGEVTLAVTKAGLVTTDPVFWMRILVEMTGPRGLVTRDLLLKMLSNHARGMFL